MSTITNSKIEQSIRQEYDKQLSNYKYLETEVVGLIKETCELNKWIFVYRIKAVESYALKLITGRTEGYLIDDFLACSIVVPNLKGIEKAKELVALCFDILDEKPNEFVSYRPTEFNFDSIRLTCRVKPSIQHKVYSDLKFEIQIKTLLEYAWSEATHDFSYKGSSASWAKERLAAQIKASLSNIDLSIYDMETISTSPFLNKRNKKYEYLSEILEFIIEAFGGAGVAIPKDVKRLSEEVLRLLKRVELELSDLKSCLDTETMEGRGYKTLNLSIFSIILVSLFKQRSKIMTSKLAKKANGPNLVIPKETNIKELYDTTKFKNVTLL
jgi:ppGpp synthetase/RelA/SpoT-type nucleotidyltranferase